MELGPLGLLYIDDNPTTSHTRAALIPLRVQTLRRHVTHMSSSRLSHLMSKATEEECDLCEEDNAKGNSEPNAYFGRG